MEAEEIWKDIPGYEGLYQVSNMGRVKSLYRKVKKWDGLKTVPEKIRKQTPNKLGYMKVMLSVENRKSVPSVHRLVAHVFIPNPENHPVINHINGNPSDNRIENLEWTTQSKNVLHGFERGRKMTTCKRVIQYTKDGSYVNEFESTEDAGRKTGINAAHIGAVARGVKDRKKAGGFIWKYKSVT